MFNINCILSLNNLCGKVMLVQLALFALIVFEKNGCIWAKWFREKIVENVQLVK